jgi:hypothetical protein
MNEALPGFIADLRRPSAYAHPVDHVELVQTHVSYVLLAGEFAYKVKKPLDLGFLDYSTLERRRLMCEEEVRLNRRFCDGVYLGVAPVTREADGSHRIGGAGVVVEQAVHMRRVPDSRMMPRLLEAGAVTQEHLSSLARKLADFHARAVRRGDIADCGRVEAVRSNWEENLEAAREDLGRTITPERLNGLVAFGQRFLDDHGPLFEERADGGRVRDGHGDLRSDAVMFEADGSVCIMDCIEFNDRLRFADVASDVAFLAMDLEYRGHPGKADDFVSLYLERAPDPTFTAALVFYRIYRACVRGKVEGLQAKEREVPAEQRESARTRAWRYFELAEELARSIPAQTAVIMMGLSGTGKSYVARVLAGRMGAVLLSTDAIRREATRPEQPVPGRYGVAGYSDAARDAVYGEMIARALAQLRSGRSVVLDATFLTQEQRAWAMDAARDSGVPALVVQVTAPEDVVRARLLARAGDGGVSDARWDTYLVQRRTVEPPVEIEPGSVMAVDASGVAGPVADAVMRRLQSSV